MTRLFHIVGIRERLSMYIANGLLVVFGVVIIALGSQFRVNIPFSPVPITAQTLSIMLIAALLGARNGALAVVLYIVVGAGLSWYASASLLGPTGGYLVGFVAMAVCIGALIRSDIIHFARSWWGIALVLLVGHVVLYVFGLTWLSFYIGSQRVFALGLFPFIPGDLLKLACATSVIHLAQNS